MVKGVMKLKFKLQIISEHQGLLLILRTKQQFLKLYFLSEPYNNIKTMFLKILQVIRKMYIFFNESQVN